MKGFELRQVHSDAFATWRNKRLGRRDSRVECENPLDVVLLNRVLDGYLVGDLLRLDDIALDLRLSVAQMKIIHHVRRNYRN